MNVKMMVDNFDGRKSVYITGPNGRIGFSLSRHKEASVFCEVYKTRFYDEESFHLEGDPSDFDQFLSMLKKFIECYESE